MAQDVKDSLLGPALHEIKVEVEEVDIKPDIVKYDSEEPDPTPSEDQNIPVMIKTEPDVSWIKIEVDALPDDEGGPSGFGNDPLKTECPDSTGHLKVEKKDDGESTIKPRTRNGKKPSHLADPTYNNKNAGKAPQKRPPLNKTSLKRKSNKNTDEKPFPCEICGYKFKKNFYLKRHLLTHTGEKPFACNVCEYKTTHKSALTTHIRIHTGEKPYTCVICDFRCSAKGTLIAHSKKHSDEKPYSCDICNYKCKQKNHLVIHAKVHTTEKPYSCDLCAYKSSRQSDVNRHLKIHGDVKPFMCNFCNYASNRLSNLRQHLLVRHK